MSELSIKIEDIDPIEIFGVNNSKFNIVEQAFPDLKIALRGDTIKLMGKKAEIEKCKKCISLMADTIFKLGKITTQQVEEIVAGMNPIEAKLESSKENSILYGKDGQLIQAKTKNQKAIVDAAEHNDIVFAIGPAGTGKTYTAVALAVRALKNREVKRIILTRPAVEAGESLGFLPGDLKEKVDPYLRPLYDALDDMIPADKLLQFKENRTIEVAPLAYMRGRTLDKSFIILDEAQNCTASQLKMFLTRLGPEAKCIVTGDLTQIDLPKSQKSGLPFTIKILNAIKGIKIIYLDESDVLRHRLVKFILKAFQQDDE